MLNGKDFFSVSPVEDMEAEKIREKNIDRLKLL
jgi:hypothetical protein